MNCEINDHKIDFSWAEAIILKVGFLDRILFFVLCSISGSDDVRNLVRVEILSNSAQKCIIDLSFFCIHISFMLQCRLNDVQFKHVSSVNQGCKFY